MNIHYVDIMIFIIYFLSMLGIGLYFMKKNNSKEDYYVGGRAMSAGHIGLSVVATDVGGGFSIGLGGLGFVMGLSGSWMLFTGLIGAWLSSVLLIPKIYKIAKKNSFLTFPESLEFFYDKKVALVAGIISFIGYVGFTSSQILAGAKLASATFPKIDINSAVLVMGIIVVGYTVIGGIKAVIYTDTVQWIILMVGLIFIGIPISYIKIGGWEVIVKSVPSEFLTLTNITFSQLINWFVTIVPIWFVGMTLYQRIYACKDEKTAIKAWRIAGLFEWPIMAFMGVLLGLFAKIALENGLFTNIGISSDTLIDPELGLPMLLRNILPVGLMGLMISAYFSAIMSTADSCLMAASGNFTSDILKKIKLFQSVRASQLSTLLIGTIAVLLATLMQSVLELMLFSYAFMVSGLLVPVLGVIFIKKNYPNAALTSMILGGSTTLILIILELELPYKLDANIFGITLSAISYIFVHIIERKRNGIYNTK